MNQRELARALGLSKQAISKLKGQGMPVDSVEAAQAWREAHQSPARRKPGPNDPPKAQPPDAAVAEDFQAARTRREIAEANLSEMKEAELRGELIRVDAIRAAWAGRIASTRDALMQLPSRLAPVLAAESDAWKVGAIMEEAIRHALTELSKPGH